ncbi:hypothetical protein H920_09643 [Fukomys damarensis]|uniref:Secreted protein n=1 Tax=Fukomys damarensis TaxID=885580 RepID=A0A091DER0_FUKDA|nr:hypothetical protein H920_09643 [Fukomys damarensis]
MVLVCLSAMFIISMVGALSEWRPPFAYSLRALHCPPNGRVGGDPSPRPRTIEQEKQGTEKKAAVDLEKEQQNSQWTDEEDEGLAQAQPQSAHVCFLGPKLSLSHRHGALGPPLEMLWLSLCPNVHPVRKA